MRKKKSTVQQAKQVQDLQQRFDDLKERAAKVRDEFRILCGDVEQVSESMDNACNSLDSAEGSMREAVEDMSQYV